MLQIHVITSVLSVSQPNVPHPPSVLFVRGAPRSGGFLEAESDFDRTEHLADINNDSTQPGNHGWHELAELLRADGFGVTQIIEPLESVPPMHGLTQGRPIEFETMDLSVFDVTGRRVRTLVDGRMEAGRFDVEWDGRDEGGRRTAPGVYFVRLQSSDFGATRKAVRLQ